MECCNFIHIKRNGSDGTSYPLLKDSTMILGRDRDCDFRLQLPSVSDKHAKLWIDKSGKAYVTSLVQTSPVSLNDMPVDSDVLVKDKSILTVGTCSFKFQYKEDIFGPLCEMNGTHGIKEVVKTPKTPVSAKKPDKENLGTTPRALVSSRKGTPAHGKKTSPLVQKPSTTSLEKKLSSTPKIPSLSRVEQQEVKSRSKRTPTPIKIKQTYLLNDSSLTRRSLRTSSSTSLISIQEQDESSASPSTPALSSVSNDSISSRQSLRNTRNSSLMSIPELNETFSSPRKRPAETSPTSFDLEQLSKKSRKSVTFGPALSPEYYDKRLPSQTPVKPGLTPQGQRRSLPAKLSTFESVEEEIEGDVDSDEYEYSMTGFEDTFLSSSSGEEESDEELEDVEESTPGVPIHSVDNMKLSTPLRREIEDKPVLRKTRRVLPTPIRMGISCQPLLRKTRRTLPTPVRKGITSGFVLRKTKRSITTPLKKALLGQHILRKTKQSMSTPVRKEIESKPSLRKTKRSITTPLKKALLGQHILRKTKQSMSTPVRKEIESKPSLKKTKQLLPTPVRDEIKKCPPLRKTKQSMSTPVRKEIESKPSLKKTKQLLPTPVRDEIKKCPPLRKTKQSMSTPVRKEIESKPSLKKTKQLLPTPVRDEIKQCPPLRKTKQSMSTPVRKEIESKPSLKKTKQLLPTPVRNEIKKCPPLRKTKQSMPTPLRKQIENKIMLRKTRKIMPTPLRKQIGNRPHLRKTKPSMPTPVRKQIEEKTTLRKTKQSLSTPVRKEIESRPNLRQTKRSLPTPLKVSIHGKCALKKTKQSLPSPLRLAIEAKPLLRKLRKTLPTPIKEAIKNRPSLHKTMPTLSTPLRDEIRSGITLTKTKMTMPSPLQREIKSKHSLHHVPVNHIGKRALQESQTPLPQPPAKKRRMAPLLSPSPYDFGKCFKPGAESPIKMEGMKRLFQTPRENFSADPSDTFYKGIFGSPVRVTFSSPVAYTAKKLSSPAQAHCFKSDAIPFSLGTCDVIAQKTTTRLHRKTVTKPTAVLRSTRHTKVKTETIAEPPAQMSVRVKKVDNNKRVTTSKGMQAKTAAKKANISDMSTRQSAPSHSKESASVESPPLDVKSVFPTKPCDKRMATTKTTEVKVFRVTRSRANKVTESDPPSVVPVVELNSCSGVSESGVNRQALETTPGVTVSKRTTRGRQNPVQDGSKSIAEKDDNAQTESKQSTHRTAGKVETGSNRSTRTAKKIATAQTESKAAQPPLRRSTRQRK